MNVLYRIQVFVGDHFRAGLLCLSMYEENATKLAELVGRHHLLERAQRHLEAAMGNANGEISSSIEQSLVIHASVDNITHHLTTIRLQGEVVQYAKTKNLDLTLYNMAEMIRSGIVDSGGEPDYDRLSIFAEQMKLGGVGDTRSGYKRGDLLRFPVLTRGKTEEQNQTVKLLMCCDPKDEQGLNLAVR